MDKNEINAIFSEMAQYKRIIEEAKTEYEALASKVKEAMTADGKDTYIGDEHKATYKVVPNNRFDTTRFKGDHIDLYNEYCKVGTKTEFRFA